ncbi:tyrosinase family protein (plasmid) [Rhizobium gallicum]|uniref:Tyrosinase family protein n=1 Tax=Rhizobium gallicum TaxID=56730 RepID=A0A1L5NQ81_9HYPH|nr:tyrosinase family protein [Rhizobium gallicum]APO70060.1 tyrosinase family protein [Rhizobium gallicum]
MIVDVEFSSVHPNGIAYLDWTPRKLSIRLADAEGANPARVRFASRTAVELRFSEARADPMQQVLEIDLPQDGSPIGIWIAGLFGTASIQDGDSGYTISDVPGGIQLISQAAMVRVRKNANGLTDDERDRFLAAMGTLNAAGSGRFRDFRDMHVDRPASDEAHFDVGFLPWHRCYLLDLERELQAIDPSVAMPYWRFDEPAPNVFTRAFMGLPNANGRLVFTAGHPLESWITDGQLGILRSMGFLPNARPSSVLSEADTLALAPFPAATQYRNFADMEGNPHGMAHTSFQGSSFIRRIPLAARDPLFFMLHCNVDRIWAKWQWLNALYDPAETEAFSPSDTGRIGHQLGDTMWPWNQVTGLPRPSTAPGGTLAASPVIVRPGPSPTVRDMLDYQGISGAEPLGFDYDDVPFDPPAGTA